MTEVGVLYLLSHELQEFLEIDRPCAIRVNGGDHLAKLCLCWILAKLSKNIANLLGADRVVTILIEELERHFECLNLNLSQAKTICISTFVQSGIISRRVIEEPDTLKLGIILDQFPLGWGELCLEGRLQHPYRLQHIGDLNLFPKLLVTSLEQSVTELFLAAENMDLRRDVPVKVVLKDAEEIVVNLL